MRPASEAIEVLRIKLCDAVSAEIDLVGCAADGHVRQAIGLGMKRLAIDMERTFAYAVAHHTTFVACERKLHGIGAVDVETQHIGLHVNGAFRHAVDAKVCRARKW